jgi:hypothetical protein
MEKVAGFKLRSLEEVLLSCFGAQSFEITENSCLQWKRGDEITDVEKIMQSCFERYLIM